MRFAILSVLIAAAWAQPPRIANARLQSHDAAGGLEPEMRRLQSAANGPEWVGYAVPILPGNRNLCCSNGDSCCSRCGLENSGGRSAAQSGNPGPIKLEGPTSLLVLFRLENHALSKVQAYSLDCELDAGGLPFHFLTGVRAADSVNYLAALAPTQKHAILALALHADASADAALSRLTAPSQPENVRSDVAFWAASARGRKGLEILQTMLRQDPSSHVREKVMFALSVSKEPEALTLLIDSAHNDASPKVRSQALFWMAHKAGQKETAAITRAIADDPDTHVKKQAVFALQQLPPDQGIPLLIQVARANTNPEVRKQALFWLGQSHDPRALKFIEDSLTK